MNAQKFWMHTKYYFVTVCIILMTFHKHNDIFSIWNKTKNMLEYRLLCLHLLLTSVPFQQFEGSCNKKPLTNSNSSPFFWSGAIKVPYPFQILGSQSSMTTYDEMSLRQNVLNSFALNGIKTDFSSHRYI